MHKMRIWVEIGGYGQDRMLIWMDYVLRVTSKMISTATLICSPSARRLTSKSTLQLRIQSTGIFEVSSVTFHDIRGQNRAKIKTN